jgi:hypothetical protein
MNTNEAFAVAARPAPVVIMRMKLRPYSIGHEILLTAEKNPLLGSWDDFDKLELPQQIYAIFRAVTICAMSWEDNQKHLQGTLGIWMRFQISLWLLCIPKGDIAVAIADWRTYRADGTTYPKILEPEEDGRMLGAPMMARLVALMGVGAFNVPLGYAQWVYFAHAEATGLCRIENEKERSIQEQIKNLPDKEKERLQMLLKSAIARRRKN